MKYYARKLNQKTAIKLGKIKTIYESICLSAISNNNWDEYFGAWK